MDAPEIALLDCLHQEIATIKEFKTVLETETRALSERDAFQELEAAVKAKNQLAIQLTELNAYRDTLLAQLGSGQGWEEVAQIVSEYPELDEAWTQLQEIAQAVQEINMHNGTLLKIHLEHTQQSLDVLNALVTPDNTYNAQGLVESPAAGGKPISAC
jgi:flagellar biosynthesis protein FlgN